MWPEACCHGRLGATRKTFGKNVTEMVGLPFLYAKEPRLQASRGTWFSPTVVRGAHRGIWMGPGTVLEGWF